MGKSVCETYRVGGRSYNRFECLLVYSDMCDKYDVTESKEIQQSSAKVIFKECEKIHNENQIQQ